MEKQAYYLPGVHLTRESIVKAMKDLPRLKINQEIGEQPTDLELFAVFILQILREFHGDLPSA
jgi:hypothetical protein